MDPPRLPLLPTAQCAYRSTLTLPDVCFTFPHTCQRLFSHSALLKSASPYFRALLGSGFSESRPSPVAGSAQAVEDGEEAGLDDSDDDEGSASAELQSIALPMHEIVVHDIAHATYAAILVYLQTEHLSFAPLLSSFRVPSSSSHLEQRRQAVNKLEQRSPGLPRPVSPKTIYHASHRLDLPLALRQLALSAFTSRLTPQNVGYELFSTTAAYYDEIKEACMEYAVDHWAEVGTSAAIREVEAMDASELPSGALAVTLEVARRLAKK